MADQPSRRNDFKFILNSVRSDALEAVAQELTQIFPLDEPTAVNIVKNAPIILLDNLSPRQGRLVGTYAIRLKALGADVQVTGQPVGKLQVLRWPLLPDIAKRPGNHVICPNCGARLQMQIFVPPTEPPPPAPEGKPSDTGIVKPITDETNEPPSQPPPAEAIEPAAPDPSAELEPESPAKPAEEGPIEEVILEPVDDELDEDEAAVESMMEDEAMVHEPSPAIEVASDVPTAVGGEGNCRVSIIGKVKGKKKLKTAAIMARYLGIEEPEALERLGKKTVVAVATGLTQKQADACKKEFADIGVKVTIKG